MSTPGDWRKEDLIEERDRFKLERNELLSVLFAPYADRLTVGNRILGVGDPEREVPTSNSMVPSDLDDCLDSADGSDLPPRDPK